MGEKNWFVQQIIWGNNGRQELLEVKQHPQGISTRDSILAFREPDLNSQLFTGIFETTWET